MRVIILRSIDRFITNARDQIAVFAFHSFFVKVETKANLRASSPVWGSREKSRESSTRKETRELRS